MKKAEKHACFECFEGLDKDSGVDLEKLHIDVPMDKMRDMMRESMIKCLGDDIFPDFWKDTKSELKDLPKKKLAREAFLTGASCAIDLLESFNDDSDEDDSDEEESFKDMLIR
jgi:hypothetical protein